jgi:hypothetical protein
MGIFALHRAIPALLQTQFLVLRIKIQALTKEQKKRKG